MRSIVGVGRSKATDHPANFLSHRPCPSCGCWHEGSFEKASEPQAETAPFDLISQGWHGFFNRPLFFSYARCTSCGLLYCPTYLSDEGLSILYAEMPDNSAGVEFAALAKTQRGYVEAAHRYGPLDGDYIELGPDIGLFTHALIQTANLGHAWLVEPNRAVHEQLGEAARPLRLDIVTAFDQLPSEARDLAVGAMVHVLDHLIDPIATLEALRGRLTDEARLVIVTHDESSTLARVAGRRWPAYCLQHPQLFRPGTISDLLRRTGFDVLGITKSVNHFPIAYLAKHAAHLMRMRLPLTGTGGPTIPLRLGNILTVASAGPNVQ